MTNLAVLLHKMGKKVRGSDTNDQYITEPLLQKYGIPVSVGFSPRQISGEVELVVYSAAHNGDRNPQVLEAQKKKIKVMHQAMFIAKLMDNFKNKIAVCGCHGKTTTSSVLSYALNNLGASPSYLVGTPTFTDFEGTDYQSNNYFVVEADEYGVNPPDDITPKFHFLNPDYILCTNIDYDHPDVYKNIDHVKKEFIKFFNYRDIFICLDDKNSQSIIGRLSARKVQTYGFSKESQLRITSFKTTENYSTFNLDYKGQRLAGFQTRLFGEKNILNITGAIYILLVLGFSPQKIKKSILNFTGAKRRLEFVDKVNDILIYDDYAHHPQEIYATLDALKKRYPVRPIIVLFQPHTYSRTVALKEDFKAALTHANYSIVLPIFASAREQNRAHVSAKELATSNVYGCESKGEAIFKLKGKLQKNSIIVTLGAGDVYKLKNDIIGQAKLV